MKHGYRCSTQKIENYRQRISGPLLDRIDLHVEVPLVDFRELTSNTSFGEESAANLIAHTAIMFAAPTD
jgi:magnesium chelatase family protein